MKTSKSDGSSSDFSEALIASGLVRRSDLNIPKQETFPSEKRRISKNLSSSQLLLEKPRRKPNILKPSILEEVIFERQNNSNQQFSKLLFKSPQPKQNDNTNDNSFLFEKRVVQKDPMTMFSNKEVLDNMENKDEITFPKTMLVLKNMGKPIVSSRANYENLSCLLKEQIESINQDQTMNQVEKLAHQREVYETFLSEMVRQGYMECSQKGDLLQKFKNFVLDATEQIPSLFTQFKHLKEYSDKKINQLTKQVQELSEANMDLSSKNNVSQITQNSLESRLNQLSLKIPDLEKETRKLR